LDKVTERDDSIHYDSKIGFYDPSLGDLPYMLCTLTFTKEESIRSMEITEFHKAIEGGRKRPQARVSHEPLVLQRGFMIRAAYHPHDRK
jgi:hypothetical protein